MGEYRYVFSIGNLTVKWHISFFSVTLRFLKVAKELIYFRVTQAFSKDILHIGPQQQSQSRANDL